MVPTAVVIAVGVNATWQREGLGLDVGPSEEGAFWLAFLRGLVARGLAGVRLVTSDAHRGLKGAIAAVLHGASWQWFRTHFMAAVLAGVPKSVQPEGCENSIRMAEGCDCPVGTGGPGE